MESSIKVDFRRDENGLQPVIAIKLTDSEDPRDRLLKEFFQALGGQSSWLSVSFDHHIIKDVQQATSYITIHPVRQSELKETIQIIDDRISGKVNSQGSLINCNPLSDRYPVAD